MIYDDLDLDSEGASVGSADEPGLPVQEEVDQRCQTDKAMGSWRPTGDLVTSGREI